MTRAAFAVCPGPLAMLVLGPVAAIRGGVDALGTVAVVCAVVVVGPLTYVATAGIVIDRLCAWRGPAVVAMWHTVAISLLALPLLFVQFGTSSLLAGYRGEYGFLFGVFFLLGAIAMFFVGLASVAAVAAVPGSFPEPEGDASLR